jgi:hypothetical protein
MKPPLVNWKVPRSYVWKFQGSTMTAFVGGLRAATFVRVAKLSALLTRKPVHAAPVQPAGVRENPPAGALAGLLTDRD